MFNGGLGCVKNAPILQCSNSFIFFAGTFLFGHTYYQSDIIYTLKQQVGFFLLDIGQPIPKVTVKNACTSIEILVCIPTQVSFEMMKSPEEEDMHFQLEMANSKV